MTNEEVQRRRREAANAVHNAILSARAARRAGQQAPAESQQYIPSSTSHNWFHTNPTGSDYVMYTGAAGMREMDTALRAATTGTISTSASGAILRVNPSGDGFEWYNPFNGATAISHHNPFMNMSDGPIIYPQAQEERIPEADPNDMTHVKNLIRFK